MTSRANPAPRQRQMPEPPAWLGRVVIATVWDTSVKNARAWLNFDYQLSRTTRFNCAECGALIGQEFRPAGFAQIGSAEDPWLVQVHAICQGCGRNHYNTLALLYAWIALVVDNAAASATV